MIDFKKIFSKSHYFKECFIQIWFHHWFPYGFKIFVSKISFCKWMIKAFLNCLKSWNVLHNPWIMVHIWFFIFTFFWYVPFCRISTNPYSWPHYNALSQSKVLSVIFGFLSNSCSAHCALVVEWNRFILLRYTCNIQFPKVNIILQVNKHYWNGSFWEGKNYPKNVTSPLMKMYVDSGV